MNLKIILSYDDNIFMNIHIQIQLFLIFYRFNIKEYSEQLKLCSFCNFNENLIYKTIIPEFFHTFLN